MPEPGRLRPVQPAMTDPRRAEAEGRRPGCNLLMIGLLLLAVALAIVIGWRVSDPRTPNPVQSGQPEAMPKPPPGAQPGQDAPR